MAKICVVGAGPAGSTYAARMAQLGHDVSLVEAARFPRAHLGESLSPGVLPLLERTGSAPLWNPPASVARQRPGAVGKRAVGPRAIP